MFLVNNFPYFSKIVQLSEQFSWFFKNCSVELELEIIIIFYTYLYGGFYFGKMCKNSRKMYGKMWEIAIEMTGKMW